MDNEIELTMEAVSERDCDLLLVEELGVSSEFVELFLNALHLGPDNHSTLSGPSAFAARHSVQRLDKSGETDIEVRVEQELPNGRYAVVLLIENKIDATFQPNQPQRYAKYAEWLVANQEADEAYSMLVAPNGYLDSNDTDAFDACVSYEEVIDYFEGRVRSSQHDETRRRSSFRQQWFEQAIYKFRRGYVPDIDDTVTDFWRRYWEVAQSQFPELAMEEPSKKPAGSDWVFFQRAISQHVHLSRADFKHKLRTGRIEIELAGQADASDGVVQRLRETLDDGVEIRRAGKALAISVQVPTIDTQEEFDANSVVDGLRQAVKLREWWERTAPTLVIH